MTRETERTHREIVTIRWSQMPKEQWIKIVLTEPSKCINACIPIPGNRKYSSYVGYSAYFVNLGEQRKFTLMFPKNRFERAINCIRPEDKKDLSRPIMFDLYKTQKGYLRIQNWHSI